MSRWRRLLGGSPGWNGTTGPPRSSNAASSLHLRWDVPPGAWTAVEATLTVDTPPAVPRLVFWALQASFVDRGRRGGGAHLGLQWYPPHPGSTAVNWGGYSPAGPELQGTPSMLPSATGNPNTRDLAWEVGRPYRLRIAPSPDGPDAWRGSVTDLITGEEVVVRDLFADGTTLEVPLVWSEVFCDCDHPGVGATWSDLAVVAADGTRAAVEAVVTSYQSMADGGCVTTDSSVVGDSIVQRTNVARRTPAGTRLTFGQTSRS